MYNNMFKTLSSKLILLSVTLILTMVTTIFMFNSQINTIKLQIDNLFFGNFVPVLKLQKVHNSYQNLIICLKTSNNCNKKIYFKEIKKNWKFYNKSYKTIKEKRVVVNVNKHLIVSLSSKSSIITYKKMISHINFLIDYEIKGAYIQRKEFLLNYYDMKSYLIYSVIGLILTAIFIFYFLMLSILQKDKYLNYLNKKYKKDSITDSMTQLNNRKYFDMIFDKMPDVSKEKNWESAFMMFDIDHFKQYNDTYGHDKGDDTLKAVANVLKTYFNKEYEYVFRLGGEEFGVILFDIDKDIVESCLKDINEKIVQLQIEHKSSSVLGVISISIGAVMYSKDNDLSTNKMYKLADEKLYKSKTNGRNQYTI